jgi:uncharacterized protein (TIGR02594 family)
MTHPAQGHIKAAITGLELALRTFDAETVPAWMHTAVGELGVRERPGAADNPRIVEYHSVTRRSPGHEDDETPWCSSFACWCMDRSGVVHTRSKRARSWMEWGRQLEGPQPGCIVVLWRGSPSSHKGHVGFFDRIEGSSVVLLGGNQGNAVSRKAYPRTRVLEGGYRWPTLSELPSS